MKEEINSFINMVLGFLNQEKNDDDLKLVGGDGFELFSERFDKEDVEMIWVLKKGKTDLEIRILGDKKNPLYSSICSGNMIPLNWVRRIYEGLPSLLKNMVYFFPSLAEKLVPLLEAEGIDTADAIRSLTASEDEDQ